MAGEHISTTEAVTGGVTFEAERFEWTAPDRLEVSGRWYGVRGHRFMRPALTVEAQDGRRRMLADLDHKPWAAQDGEEWLAAFPWDGDPIEVAGAELAVAPSVAVDLPAPAVPGRSRKAASRATRSRRGTASPGRAEEVAALRAQLAEAQETVKRLTAELDDAHDLLAAESREAADRAAIERERDRALAHHEVVVGERDSVIAQRDDAIAARHAAVAERDRAISARDEALADRDAALARRDEAVSHRESAVTERDGLRAQAALERDTVRDERDAAVRARAAADRERDEAQDRRAVSDWERKAAIAERDTALSERDQALEAHRAAIRELDELERGSRAPSRDRQPVARPEPASDEAPPPSTRARRRKRGRTGLGIWVQRLAALVLLVVWAWVVYKILQGVV
jgi:hypothetical protein